MGVTPSVLHTDLGEVLLLPSGPRAVLLEVADTASTLAVAERLHRAALPGVTDIVPGARTVLVISRAPITPVLPQVTDAVVGADVTGERTASAHTVEIPVVYDGIDLASVAAHLGATTDEVIAQHAGATYTVAFCGFSPGFAYLVGLPASLHLPRRSEPRPRVPAGSVAIAGGHTAVYPSASPGGWHLLGRTDTVLWDVHRDPPALLTPGTSVRFTVVRSDDARRTVDT
jgi:KipI family sensor histidine kinase inhibitor